MANQSLPRPDDFTTNAVKAYEAWKAEADRQAEQSLQEIELATQQVFRSIFSFQPTSIDGSVVSIGDIHIRVTRSIPPAFQIVADCPHCGRKSVNSIPCTNMAEIGQQLLKFQPHIEGDHYCGGIINESKGAQDGG
ncbi:MAG: hypothetical protein OEZ02_00920 [Anaerolineae bacterium]|nr:hypothetical protein [Anaerolineae bacterium]